MIPRVLRPDLRLNSIYDLPLSELKTRGINGLIFDLDNTLTEWNRPSVNHEMESWLARLQEDFKICIVSNNSGRRVDRLAVCLGIPAIHRARKPQRGGFHRALVLLGTKPGATAVIGDQLFTDIAGGNRAGMFTVLVAPLSSHEYIGTRLMRVLEKRILKRLTDS